MCGIVGVYNLDGQPFPEDRLKSMANAIAHRGPDGEGYYTKDNIALGHKRLAILDTTPKGSQPMSSKNGEWIIVFNGCIYNYLELRQELQALCVEYQGESTLSHQGSIRSQATVLLVQREDACICFRDQSDH